MKPHAVATHSSDSHPAGHEALDADLHGLTEPVAPRWRALAARSKEAAHQLSHHYHHAQRRTQEQVQQHPLKSVAVAVGLGALLGAVIVRLGSTRRARRSNGSDRE